MADQPVGNYWMRGHFLDDCILLKFNLLAVIRYDGAPDVLPPEPEDFKPNSGVVSFQFLTSRHLFEIVSFIFLWVESVQISQATCATGEYYIPKILYSSRQILPRYQCYLS